ncbi:hypothetical protein ACH5RR_026947 [Cinchona calisaya]|uniref:Uncharacterized protein n=1 Tax=Cinchona calisaya TaxID=153742 RepID=A0ABD2Z7D5_9GENT
MERNMELEPGRNKRGIVVLVPLPLQGHMTPMLQLGTILYSKGFTIVVAHSEFRPPNPSNHPEFIFQLLSDNLSGYDACFMNLLNLISDINAKCRAPFEEYIVRLMQDQRLQHGNEVACIIYDGLLHFVDSVATCLKITSIVLRPSPAIYMLS